MNAAIDLNDIERKAYTSRWEDGLLDLFVGLAVTLVGIAWLTPWGGLGGIAPVLLVPIWAPARRRWIEPRAGHVVFGAARRRREQMGAVGLAALGAATLALGVLAFVAWNRAGGQTDLVLRTVIPALPGVLIGAGGVLAGLGFQAPRLITYGLLSVALAAAFTYAGLEPGVYLAVTGLAVTVAGAVRLAGWLRAHPVPDQAGV